MCTPRHECESNELQCILRPCLQWIESAEAQGHATVFVAKFFGRAGLMSFISSVPDSQRPALFQSLLFEACGRTVNPVNGAVGLLWTGNWHVCQAAMETVLRGGSLRPIPELLSTGSPPPFMATDQASKISTSMWRLPRKDGSTDDNPSHHCRFSRSKAATEKRKRQKPDQPAGSNLDLHLNHGLPSAAPCKEVITGDRPGTPSMISEESVTTSCWDGGFGDQYGNGGERKLLNLFV
ncbi:PREDICTED: LOB domain-containing protein 39 [Tarenaya hassleriana]|uniref:LOB domain-containing protein 39 n=1 Tax=Tarenaya hassleriana TaxID=28532 RepID=UPI00053C1C3B|nr:PREDICTED: LOB domain-containing protein 39 [Tarenaya hassleriana]